MGSLIRIYTVYKHNFCSKVTSVNPVNAQADLCVPCSHVIRPLSVWRAANDYGVSLDSDEHTVDSRYLELAYLE